MIYLKLIIQTIGVLLVCGLFLYVRRKSSPSLNEWAVMQWMRDMDVVAHGQRWQGMRTKSVFATSITRKSFASYVYEVVCVTRSGRWFLLHAETNMALLVRWEIAPLKPTRAAELLEVEESELDGIIKMLEWDAGIQAEKSSTKKTHREPRSIDLARPAEQEHAPTSSAQE